MQRHSIGAVLRVLPATLLAASIASTVFARPSASTARDDAAPGPAAALHTLFDDHHRWSNIEFPQEALRRGEPTDAQRLTDPSPAAIARRAAATRAFLDRVRAIDPTILDDDDRELHALFERDLAQAIEGFERGAWCFAIGPIYGPHQDIAQLNDRVPFHRLQDFRDYLSRLQAVPQALEAQTEVLRAGIERGMVPPRVTVERVPQQCDAIIRGKLAMLLEPLARMPAETTPEQAESLRTDASAAVDRILEALARYRDFVRDVYLPACRESIAAIDLPDGAGYYEWCLRHHTTTSLTADEIHAIGLAEVARIRAEMMGVIRRTDWWNDDRGSADDEAIFAAFIAYLRSDPRFYHTSADALIDGYRTICKRVDGLLPGLFRTMPRLPYGVREIPRFMAPSQTTAYYQPGSIEGGVAGFFCANTYALDQRPTYEMVPLALHEAVPGHHLQIALAQEQPERPFFLREGYVTAFGEGWALYAERLGIEMGLYRDPYDDFGRLLYEMWRSCRLVVDTGMHAKAWSRQQAIDFMLSNSALSELNIEREVDRYIAWPGQACAYKIGELAIRRLRAEAESRLGPAFDIRAFHDAVLLGGAVPLTVLEQRVRSWIERVAAGSR